MRSALDWAHQNIPKALISLNGMLPLSTLKTAGDKDQHCLSIRFLTATLCPCAFNSEGDARWMDNVVSAANRHQQELAREWDKKGSVSMQQGWARERGRQGWFLLSHLIFLSSFISFFLVVLE